MIVTVDRFKYENKKANVLCFLHTCKPKLAGNCIDWIQFFSKRKEAKLLKLKLCIHTQLTLLKQLTTQKDIQCCINHQKIIFSATKLIQVGRVQRVSKIISRFWYEQMRQTKYFLETIVRNSISAFISLHSTMKCLLWFLPKKWSDWNEKKFEYFFKFQVSGSI